MSSTDLDDEFEQILEEIEAVKPELREDEQTFVDAWVSKLREFGEEGKAARNDYAQLLRSQVTREERHLSLPYIRMPPESQLPGLEEFMNSLRTKETPPSQVHAQSDRRRYLCLGQDQKQPCRAKATPSVRRKSPERVPKSTKNEFEDPEEMAKSIARSKGMMLSEFVADISLHTADKGRELIAAMKDETANFNDYVERIMTQRTKDLADLLDSKQRNELVKIQRDYDKWQSELSVCKKQLREIVPDFDLDAYRKDRNYMKKIFSVTASNRPPDDSFKEWKEENCLRLMWLVNDLSKLTEENNQVINQISTIKSKTLELENKESANQKCHAEFMCVEDAKYQRLKQESEKLDRKIAEVLMSLKN